MEPMTTFDLRVSQHQTRTERVNRDGWRRPAAFSPQRLGVRQHLATVLIRVAAQLDPSLSRAMLIDTPAHPPVAGGVLTPALGHRA